MDCRSLPPHTPTESAPPSQTRAPRYESHSVGSLNTQKSITLLVDLARTTTTAHLHLEQAHQNPHVLFRSCLLVAVAWVGWMYDVVSSSPFFTSHLM